MLFDRSFLSTVRPAIQTARATKNLDPSEPLTACFTGPRPKGLYGYQNSAYRSIQAILADVVDYLACTGTVRFISGGAQGIDMLGALAVDLNRHTGHPDLLNEVFVPFPSQPDKWPDRGLFGQDAYRDMLEHASHVTTLYADPVDGRDAVAKLRARNEAMVDESDFVIAWLTPENENWETAKGGTAACVRYAHSKGKVVLGLSYRYDREEDKMLPTYQWIL